MLLILNWSQRHQFMEPFISSSPLNWHDDMKIFRVWAGKLGGGRTQIKDSEGTEIYWGRKNSGGARCFSVQNNRKSIWSQKISPMAHYCSIITQLQIMQIYECFSKKIAYTYVNKYLFQYLMIIHIFPIPNCMRLRFKCMFLVEDVRSSETLFCGRTLFCDFKNSGRPWPHEGS